MIVWQDGQNAIGFAFCLLIGILGEPPPKGRLFRLQKKTAEEGDG